jgi:proteasome lid subunit RPN8/RPN11
LTTLVHLPEELRHQILEHCLATLPNEACGMLAMDGDRVVKVYPTGNDDESPISYTIPPQEHFDALTDAESHGWRLGGVFHSHPHGPARMSDTDVARVADPQWVYVVVGFNSGAPELAGWRDGITVEI